MGGWGGCVLVSKVFLEDFHHRSRALAMCARVLPRLWHAHQARPRPSPPPPPRLPEDRGRGGDEARGTRDPPKGDSRTHTRGQEEETKRERAIDPSPTPLLCDQTWPHPIPTHPHTPQPMSRTWTQLARRAVKAPGPLWTRASHVLALSSNGVALGRHQRAPPPPPLLLPLQQQQSPPPTAGWSAQAAAPLSTVAGAGGGSKNAIKEKITGSLLDARVRLLCAPATAAAPLKSTHLPTHAERRRPHRGGHGRGARAYLWARGTLIERVDVGGWGVRRWKWKWRTIDTNRRHQVSTPTQPTHQPHTRTCKRLPSCRATTTPSTWTRPTRASRYVYTPDKEKREELRPLLSFPCFLLNTNPSSPSSHISIT